MKSKVASVMYLHRVGSEFLLGFVTLFSIINPLGVSFVFLDMSQRLSRSERRALAYKISIYSCLVILSSLVVGSAILEFFGISLSALRIAGGLSVASAGWGMLNAAPGRTRAQRGAMDTTPVTHMAFFPFTIPLTTGPGTIAAAIALAASKPVLDWGTPVFGVASFFISIAIALLIYSSYSNASRIAGWIGEEGTRVVTRLSAFLLLCVGVQIMLTGVDDVLRPPAGVGA